MTTKYNAKQPSYDDLLAKLAKQEQALTDIKAEKQQIEQQYQILEHVFSLTPNHVYWKDINGVYLGCNDGQAISLGLEKGADVVGKTDQELPWLSGPEIFAKVDQEVIRTRCYIAKEETSILPNGREVALYSTKHPLIDPERDEVVGIIGISVDITAMKISQMLEAENDASKQLIKMLETLSGSMAHDLRTPLATVYLGLQGILQFLPSLLESYYLAVENKLISSQFRRHQLKALDHTINSLLRQVNVCHSIIDMQLENIKNRHIESDNFEYLAIKEIVSEAVAEYPLSPSEKSIVHFDLRQDFQFLGEEKLTKNIIWNLLKNALYFIKAANKGDIHIWLVPGKKINRLHFKDTGKGMSAKTCKKIFNSFFSKRENGTGIGLAHCKLIMEAYGGNIRCIAREDQYAEFILEFRSII